MGKSVCRKCEGSGKLRDNYTDEKGRYVFHKTICSECGGTGEVEYFKALKEAAKNNEVLDFWKADEPKCPHCGKNLVLKQHELWNLREEGEHHDVECPYCDGEFTVETSVEYSFSTCDQETLVLEETENE